jgi:hypothetical protein
MLTIFLMLMVFITPVLAEDNFYGDMPVIVLVDIKSWDLADHEMEIFNGKKLVEVTKTDGWEDIVSETRAAQVIVKHPSGYTGLYSGRGEFIREIKLKDNDIPQYYTQDPVPEPIQHQARKNWEDTGYETGGVVDPYKPRRDKVSDGKYLNPGWGYATVPNKKRGFGSKVMDLARVAPLDTVSPFNYAGTYGGSSIAAAYGLGVIPHIGSFVASLRKGKDDNAQYNNSIAARNEFVDYPVQYYNSTDPSNPISRDPNMFRIDQMPQAFDQQVGDQFYRDANYYQHYGQAHP